MKYEVYDSENRKVFHYYFSSLDDLVTFVEKAKFSHYVLDPTCVSSSSKDYEFYGVPFDETLEFCRYGADDANMKNFLKLKNQLEQAMQVKTEKRRVKHDYSGYAPNIGAYFRGNPKAMYRLEREEAKKFITIYYNCATSCFISQDAILHKGVITLALIRLLEAHGYRVKFHFFEMSEYNNEINYNEISLKKEQETLNVMMCYFPMTNRAFLRRIIFRIVETTEFSQNWLINGYGRVMDTKDIKKILNVNNHDILINHELELGICGKDLYDDAISYFESIGLEQYLDLDKSKILTR